jgi:hypothetical protein
LDPKTDDWVTDRGQMFAQSAPIAVYLLADYGGGTQGSLTHGLVVVMPNGQDSGGVYCAGPGSTYTLMNDWHEVRATLRGLSMLGSCADGHESAVWRSCVAF